MDASEAPPDRPPAWWRRVAARLAALRAHQWPPVQAVAGAARAVAGAARAVPPLVRAAHQWWRQRLPRRARLACLAALCAAAAGAAAVLTATWLPPASSDARWVAWVADEPGPAAHQTPAGTPHRYQPPLARAVPAEPSTGPQLPPPRPEAGPGTPADPEPSGPSDPSGPGDPVPSEFVTWAVMNLHTGAITGSDTLTQTSTTASMIKVWLVADYLRIHGDPGEERLGKFTLIVRDSNNEYSQQLFEELGEEASIHRLISICGLTDSHAVPGFWSNTRLSGRDTARMGACIADGRATGDPQWTEWLLTEMRLVRGIGDFGIRHALPPGERGGVAIKNGWVVRSDVNEYHVNCLAIGNGWSMGVLTRYPAHLGYLHGAEICRSLAAQHLP